jgi:hypothetical protein
MYVSAILLIHAYFNYGVTYVSVILFVRPVQMMEPTSHFHVNFLKISLGSRMFRIRPFKFFDV